MKAALAVASALLLLIQFGSPKAVEAQTGTEEPFGRVVRYDSISNTGTANGDMILMLRGNGGFVRLLYSPHDFGFDAPPANTDQLLPPEMFTDGKLTWKFRVHPARNAEEKAPCSSIPQKGLRDRDGTLKLTQAYAVVPGSESVVVPPLESLQCRIVVRWGRE